MVYISTLYVPTVTRYTKLRKLAIQQRIQSYLYLRRYTSCRTVDALYSNTSLCSLCRGAPVDAKTPRNVMTGHHHHPLGTKQSMDRRQLSLHEITHAPMSSGGLFGSDHRIVVHLGDIRERTKTLSYPPFTPLTLPVAHWKKIRNG